MNYRIREMDNLKTYWDGRKAKCEPFSDLCSKYRRFMLHVRKPLRITKLHMTNDELMIVADWAYTRSLDTFRDETMYDIYQRITEEPPEDGILFHFKGIPVYRRVSR